MSKFGIIQSRGLGDILIALPIAKYYADEGHEIYWPICEEFWPSVKDHVPWIKWIPIPADRGGEFFYNEPVRRLRAFGCLEFICLYQSLNVVPELSRVPYFQIQHFDEFKYSKAGVPFLEKWNLSNCITRIPSREDELYNRVVSQPMYYVTHLEGSNFVANPDFSNVPKEWQRIDIRPGMSHSVFDWLRVLEGAQAIIAIDSVIANMVDQLKIKGVDKYWIPRSHIHLTPVLGTQWVMLDPPPGSLAAQQIFQASPG
jgi:hypothetical protein